MYPQHTNSPDTQKLLSLFYLHLLFSPPLYFQVFRNSKIFSPMTRGAGTATKTVEDMSSKALADLIDCDGFEGVYSDYQRQMKFKKGSPRTHLRIFQCPFLPKHFVWAIIMLRYLQMMDKLSWLCDTNEFAVLSHKLLHLNHILI